jgi:hypothetical protein
MNTQDNEMLLKHVQSIADTLSNGFNDDDLNSDDEPMSAYDYLTDSLDINWILNNDKSYRGARVLVAFGGPNIWVDTERGIVEGNWWGEYAKARFDDNIGLDDALNDIYNC